MRYYYDGIKRHAFTLYLVDWIATHVSMEQRLNTRRKYFDERYADICTFVEYTEDFGYEGGVKCISFEQFMDTVYPNTEVIEPLLKTKETIELYRKDLMLLEEYDKKDSLL